MNYLDKLLIRIQGQDDASDDMKKVENASLGIGKAAGVVAGAFAAWQIIEKVLAPAISQSMQLEATMESLIAVTESTGRDFNIVLDEMAKHTGGLASEANIASGFLKGLTTELSVEQISNMTAAIREASIAMGEDFNTQLPLITKAIKQLNPAILDNIGVTIRLDRLNKKIRDGYYGLNTEINEATQQNAIYIEIMRQTAKFKGQEAAILETSKGKWMALTAATEDMMASMGSILTTSPAFKGAIDVVTEAVRGMTDVFKGHEEIGTAAFVRTMQSFEEQADKSVYLAGRYDELRSQTELNAEEQTELNDVMEELLEMHPSLASAWDSTGKAIGVNTDRLQDNINMQRQVMAMRFADHVKKLGEEYKDIEDIEIGRTQMAMMGWELRRSQLDEEMKYWFNRSESVREFQQALDEHDDQRAMSLLAFTNSVNAYNEALLQRRDIDEDLLGWQEKLFRAETTRQKVMHELNAIYPEMISGSDRYRSAILALSDELGYEGATGLIDALLVYQEELNNTNEGEGEAVDALAAAREAILEKADAIRQAEEATRSYAAFVNETLGISIPKAIEDMGDDYEEVVFDMEMATITSFEKIENSQNQMYDNMLARSRMSAEQIIEEETKQMVWIGQLNAQEAMNYREMKYQELEDARFVNDIIVNNAYDAVHENVQAWMDGRIQFRDIFKGIAEDWVTYFIEQSLHRMIDDFIGSVDQGTGILGLIGTLFDTTANDMMAAKQGSDFAEHFTRGMMDKLDQSGLGQGIASHMAPFDAMPMAGQGSRFGNRNSRPIMVVIDGGANGQTNYVEMARRIGPEIVRLAENNENDIVVKRKLTELISTQGMV